jgi:hypothetical protein
MWRTRLFCLVSLGGVRLSPLCTSATVGLLYQPRMIDDECGAVGGMRIGRGNRSTRRKPAPLPLCLPQIPHDLTWDRTRTAAVGSQRLTAWAMHGLRTRLECVLMFRPEKHVVTLELRQLPSENFPDYYISEVGMAVGECITDLLQVPPQNLSNGTEENRSRIQIAGLPTIYTQWTFVVPITETLADAADRTPADEAVCCYW